MTTRHDIWARLNGDASVVVIGGGITGAAVLLAAAEAGVDCLLLEAHDFASGTSSRSSKLIHGGLRYLKNGQVASTYQALRERRRLAREEPALVTSLDNSLLAYRGDRLRPWLTSGALAVYDAMALTWAHERESPDQVMGRVPAVAGEGLLGAHRYAEATTDDARLVLTVLERACQLGGVTVNYAKVETVHRRADGRVAAVAVRDLVSGTSHEITCRVVVNATGAWGDDLRRADGRAAVLRHLRGSHLFFPADRFPLAQSISFMHPSDGRPVFAYAWQGVTLLGTTDVDHAVPMTTEVRCTPAEVDYLMDGVQKVFPTLGLEPGDALSSTAGVRPVVRGRHDDPSKESRESLLLDEDGLVSIVGGKLTTFRPMGRHAAAAALKHLGVSARPSGRLPPADTERAADGQAPHPLVRGATEAVVHLDDLLLRRTRLGLTTVDGGVRTALEFRPALQPLLGWDDDRWDREVSRYRDLWRDYYSPPTQR